MSQNNESGLAVWEQIVYTPTSSPPESVLSDVTEPRTPQEEHSNKSQVIAGDKKPEKDEGDTTADEPKSPPEEGDTTIPCAKKRLPRVRLGPTVRECNWEQFKNHYSVEDAAHAIEVLLAGDELDEEMEDEQLKRLSAKQREKFLDANERKPLRQSGDAKGHDERLIKRVRINSPAVLSLLSKVTGEDFCVTKPHTFLRPFKSLIHFHDKMEEKFASLEARVGQPGELATKVTSTNDTSSAIEEARAYEEVKTYIQFVNDRLLPIYHKFDNLDFTHQPKVRYSDLWYLFRYGEVLHTREDPSVGERLSPSHKSIGQQLWRMYWMQRGVTDWRVDDLKDENSKLRRNDLPRSVDISIPSYYIDFDGKSYTGVWRHFTIPQFEGEVAITSLPIYPIRFQRGYENTLQYFRERGQRFRDLLSQQYVPVRHSGWTLAHKPSGYLLRDKLSDESKKDDEEEEEEGEDEENLKGREVSEYIEGDVVINFEEAYKAHPSWKPQYANWCKCNLDTDTDEDKFAIIQWSDPDRTKVIQKTYEVVITADDVGSLEWNRLADKDDFAIHASVRVTEKDPSKRKFSPDDIALLPARLMGYSLKHRCFVNVDIANIKELSTDSDYLSKLLIPAADKVFINAMMQDHYDQQDMQLKLSSTRSAALCQSPDSHQSKALTILLHGPPGVGKTTAAEALAGAHRKGLLTISCNDLGIDVEMMENKLLDTISLVKNGNCVLHIIEPENLLSRQEKGDSLSKNALMSALFRTLKKYHGVSFIEVKEDGALIKGLASEVDVSVAFNLLDLDQTLALFKMNIEHYKLIARQRAADTDQSVLVIREEGILTFVQQSFAKFFWWNGHQISKAFQMATSLAYVEQKDATERYLGREHFEKVMKFVP